MSKSFADKPCNEFSLSTDINQNQPKSSAKSDTFGSIMACIRKLDLKPLLAMYVANRLCDNYINLCYGFYYFKMEVLSNGYMFFVYIRLIHIRLILSSALGKI
ncbi:hypothetical protein [Gilliamella sp. wkB112]|uniref:hypothetical protein n=1 Tax=Gilliamella sp. wkB112 TaxID=3120257 RepID=UPI00080EDCD1|nr:hypothetical protein [Gilliamella apicola]OCG05258.1 hypothetical protein A9G12_05890 [Gilliamella apicola]